MKPSLDRLQAALQSRQLNYVTQGLGNLADQLAYRLKPPYTEVVQSKAEQEDETFFIKFAAKLYLHYTSLQTHNEGLVFTLQFSGETYADSANPPMHELFSVGLVDSLLVFGYGNRWDGRQVPTPDHFLTNLEVSVQTINEIPTDDFLRRLSREE
jgi:hypothetical protein